MGEYMGRVRAHTSSSPSRIRMRWSLVLVCVLLLVAISEGAKKEAFKGEEAWQETWEEAFKTRSKGRMRCWLSKVDSRKHEEVHGQWKMRLLVDITRNDCACCKKGVGAMQCGFPMHKFCYKKSDKGCPGVCNYKYTLSGKDYPCFSDHSNTDCAWCNKEGWQCEQNS